MTNTATTTNTPGFNCRLQIFFSTNKNGQRQAFRWSFMQFRAIRMPLADAEMFLANETADLLPGHPLKVDPRKAR